MMLDAYPVIKKRIEINSQIYYNVEDFRKPGMDDYETLMAAYNSVPNYSKIVFAPKTYIFSHTPIMYKALDFYGPAILKREDQITYTLKEPADETSTTPILNSTDGINERTGFLCHLARQIVIIPL